MDVSKLLEKAREATERRNYDYAIELYLQACKLSPDDATARRELRAVENRMAKEKGTSLWAKTKVAGMHGQVMMLFKTSKFDAAIEKAEETLKIDPGNVSVMMLLGRAAMSAGYKQTAVATFEDIKTTNAGGNAKALIEALRELAYAYEAVGKIKEAMDTWQLVNKYTPGGSDRDATVKLRDLSAHTMTQTIESAARTGERGASARSTQTDEQKRETAKLDLMKGEIKSDADLKLALEFAKEEIVKRPDDPRVYAKLGDLFRQANDYAEAKKQYELARQKDANNYTWLFKLHDLEIWKMVNALKALEPKAKTDPAARDQFIKDRLTLLEYRLTSFVEREKQYSTDSKIKYELGRIYFDLATAKKEKSLFDEAISRFQLTFRDPKFRLDSGLFMGQGFAAKGQYDLALKRFDEALQGLELKNEHWKNLTYFKGDTLHKANRKEDAKKAFLEIYEIDMKFKDVGKRIEEIQ